MTHLHRAPSIRRSRFIRKLSAYAAASTSLAAFDASASIVHVNLGDGRPLDGFQLDFNFDGVHELSFASEQFIEGCTSGGFCPSAWSSGTRRVVEAADHVHQGVFMRGYDLARRFGDGERISFSTTFLGFGYKAILSRTGEIHHSGGCDSSFSTCRPLGGYFQGERGYLGLWFAFDENTFHYGWVDLDSEFIYGFAYETDHEVPILAGDIGPLIGGHGDTDRDGDVDLDDLNNVRNHFGQLGAEILGDDNQDGVVDLDDLNTVRNNFGTNSGANPVPEPPSLVLLAAGAAGLAVWRRKRASAQSA